MRQLLVFASVVCVAACGKVLSEEPDAGLAPDATTEPDAAACGAGDDDDDGVCDDVDECLGDPGNDPDDDGVCAATDACAGVDSTGDLDGDEVCNDRDACRGDDATGDADSDDACDAVDPCPNDSANACVTACVIAFDDQWFLNGQGYDPNTYYATYGVGFDNTAGFGLIDGQSNGDSGSWAIEGSNGPAAWGQWPGAHAVTFTAPAVGVSLDFLRGHEDATFLVEGYLDGTLYDSVTVSLGGANDVETVTFALPIDEIRWSYTGYFGVDNIRYTTTTSCPPAASSCRVWFDDARTALGDGANPDTYYSPYGVRFDNTAGYGLIGGQGNGDPGNWDIEGSYGSAAWGLWPGAHSFYWESGENMMNVRVDFLRGFTDHNFSVEGHRDGAVVQNLPISLVGAFNTQTARYTTAVDRVAWNFSGYIGVDNIRWITYGTCPPAP